MSLFNLNLEGEQTEQEPEDLGLPIAFVFLHLLPHTPVAEADSGMSEQGGGRETWFNVN